MSSRVLNSASLGAAAWCLVAAAPVPVAPPAAFPPGDTVDTIQGVKVADPYRALENWDDPAVKAWSDAQNARARSYLDGIARRDKVAGRIKQLITDRSAAYFGLKPTAGGVFATYDEPSAQQPKLVLLDPAASPGSRRILLDPVALDPTGHTAIDWYVPSPDGTKLAVSLSKGGSEDGTLHVYDVATLKEIEPPIDRVQFPTGGGSLAWNADSSGFWYTRYPDHSQPESEWHFNMGAFWHKLGTPVVSDKLVLSKTDGLPRTAEIFLTNAQNGPNALASVQLGDGGQWQHFVLTSDGKAQRIADYRDRIVSAVIAKDGTVYGVSRRDAPMGKIVRLPPPWTGGFAKAHTVIAALAKESVIDGVAAPLTLAGDRLYVARIAGGPSSLTSYALSGTDAKTIPLPAIATAADLTPMADGSLLYLVSTYLEPPAYYRLDPKTGTATKTELALTSAISYTDAEVTRVFAPSKDGTMVPINVIMKKGTKLDGKNPLLLTGYGGYGVNITPGFSGARTRMFLDAGGIMAIANLRGGGEYGESWHEQGSLTRKQNVFDDMAGAAQFLIDKGYTSHDKLALIGGSNGGLLMGAEITQHPGLARAVVSQVGIYDMMRVELDPNGAFNVTEFGTVKDPAQFKALYAYSPYHHVVQGTKYPAVLMTTGANDGRVNPLNSRKFTAALQAANASDRPILLRTSANAGHGIGYSLEEIISLNTDVLMFLLDQLGMDATKAAGDGS